MRLKMLCATVVVALSAWASQAHAQESNMCTSIAVASHGVYGIGKDADCDEAKRKATLECKAAPGSNQRNANRDLCEVPGWTSKGYVMAVYCERRQKCPNNWSWCWKGIVEANDTPQQVDRVAYERAVLAGYAKNECKVLMFLDNTGRRVTKEEYQR